jgi:membrane-associated protease RseP (regulator of RpoE activity)
MARLAQVGRINGVNVYVHWSVFAISGLILLGAIQRPAISLIGLLGYLGVILIHEAGHLLAAQRKGCAVFSIELYPIWGITRFSAPFSRLDLCQIAWAGVLAQAVVALPLLAWVQIFGYTRFETINAALAILGAFSVLVAVLNLIPVPPLDGATAWGIFPALIEQARRKKARMRAR